MSLLPFVTDHLEAGCDEAGRGCLAGPVVAASVILPNGFKNQWLNDSKKLNEKRRNELRIIVESEALSWGVGFVDPEEIDRINILQASFLAMHRAIDKLKKKPSHLAIDGNRFKKYRNIKHSCIVKGDGKYMNIAAASILAKTHRDEYMYKIHQTHPKYDWNKNKGYPTKAHRLAISLHGITEYHRSSFKLLPDQYEIAFN